MEANHTAAFEQTLLVIDRLRFNHRQVKQCCATSHKDLSNVEVNESIRSSFIENPLCVRHSEELKINPCSLYQVTDDALKVMF